MDKATPVLPNDVVVLRNSTRKASAWISRRLRAAVRAPAHIDPARADASASARRTTASNAGHNHVSTNGSRPDVKLLEHGGGRLTLPHPCNGEVLCYTGRHMTGIDAATMIAILTASELPQDAS